MAALFSELSNPSPLNGVGVGVGGVNGNSLEDKRALELALELTMLNFGDPNAGIDNLMQQHHQQQSSGLMDPTGLTNPLSAFSALIGGAGGVEERTKKSQNMTECVPVPSSEHVAEIVGRQGKFIQSFSLSFQNLHFKINTWINLFFVSQNSDLLCAAKMKKKQQHERYFSHTFEDLCTFHRRRSLRCLLLVHEEYKTIYSIRRRRCIYKNLTIE